MNKRKGFLEDLYNDNSSLVLNKLYRYFIIFDIDMGTIHSKIFFLLYLAVPRPTYEDICDEMSIGMTTLKAYKKRYEELAIKLLQNDMPILNYII